MQIQFTLSHRSGLGDFETIALPSQLYLVHRIVVVVGKIGEGECNRLPHALGGKNINGIICLMVLKKYKMDE